MFKCSYKSKQINYSKNKFIKLINIIKYKHIEYIMNLLGNMKTKGAIFLKEIILNAYNNFSRQIESQKHTVFIKNIIINQSRIVKKMRPASQGRANQIKKKFVKMILILNQENKWDKR
ncbi:uL22 family ribosomal protein [Candidatus Karelsulcia muelleri]